MKKNSKIYISGHRGMVGSAIKRQLEKIGYNNFICKTKQELDLLNPTAVQEFFDREKPEYVFHAAAKVGGIRANDIYSADFIYENITIQTNVIYNCFRSKVKKLLFLGSSCIYPKECPQPIKEEYLLTGPLEKTNEAYALAKIAGVMMCQMYRKQYGCDFISVMPTNLYGINDHYHLENSHVVPALIRKFHEAAQKKEQEVGCWGTGKPYREFMYVDDLADACLFLMLHYSGAQQVNVGTGEDITIKDLAELIAQTVGYRGTIRWDTASPDGTMRKRLDVSKLHQLGWKHRMPLADGLKIVFQDYLARVVGTP
jgi:GDP-L-fucose synthase